MVFANLIHTQLDAVLEFLCSVPGPDGQPALQFVLTEWCSKQRFFYGAYEIKVRWVNTWVRMGGGGGGWSEEILVDQILRLSVSIKYKTGIVNQFKPHHFLFCNLLQLDTVKEFSPHGSIYIYESLCLLTLYFALSKWDSL